MTVATARRLSLVPALPALPAGDAEHVVVPVPRTSDAAPWRTEGEVAFVPAVLLLAAAGRCSCEDCCAVLASTMRSRSVSAV